MEELRSTFKPEFLNRVDETIVFHRLSQEHMFAITQTMLRQLKERFLALDIQLAVPEEAARWVKVSWVEGSLPSYQTSLELSAKDRDGLTLDVAMALSTAKVKVSALSARSMPDGYASVSVVLEVKDREELSSVINKLNNIQGVYQVVRASGK